MVEVYTVKQGGLTPDCWTVQFMDFKACATCEYFLGEECGGGKTLTIKILRKLGGSQWDENKAYEYWEKEVISEEDKTFFNFMNWCKNQSWGHPMEYGFRKYKRTVKMIQESSKTPEDNTPIIKLDKEYPFKDIFYNKDNKIISQIDYHYGSQCTCEKTTKKGSYRDVIIDLPNGVRLYYYHQHCIMRRIGNKVIIDSCGFRTLTTRERVDRYLENNRIAQDKFRWYLSPKGDWSKKILLYDGMEVID